MSLEKAAVASLLFISVTFLTFSLGNSVKSGSETVSGGTAPVNIGNRGGDIIEMDDDTSGDRNSEDEDLGDDKEYQNDIVKCVCDGSCEHLRAEECRHGVTFDMCRCCLVCARGENEPCGGALGTCAFGLHCQLNTEDSVAINNLNGTTPLLTQEGTCSRVGRCGQLQDQYGCVVDPEGDCVCLTRRACPGEKMFLFEDENSCRSRMAFLIAKKDLEPATSTPTPSATGNCSQVKCTPVESCPQDSYRLPALVEPQKKQSSQGGCCPTVSSHKCQCIPDLLCSPKECPHGWVAHISKNATGRPGGCCPKFECLPKAEEEEGEASLSGERKSNHQHDHFYNQQNYHHPPEKLHGAPSLHPSSSRISFDSRDMSLSLEDDDDEEDDDEEDDEDDSRENFLDVKKRKSLEKHHLTKDREEDDENDGHCFHNGQIYKPGGSWTVNSECSQCFCDKGIVSCKPITCDVPAECRLARAQPLSCCPVCDGCVSETGKAYNMSETWQEDSCTNCTCQGGRIQCHVSMCRRQHSCNNPKHYPGECCPRCENEPPDTGHPHPISPQQQDKDSCPFRECHRDVSCPNGFRLDKSGCLTCECQKCQSLVGCKLSCSQGFKVDSGWCPICECRESLNSLVFFPSPRSRNGNNESSQQEISSSSSVYHSSTMKVDQGNPSGNPGNNKDLIGRNHFTEGNHYHHHNQNKHHHFRNENGEKDTSKEEDDDLYGYGYGSNEGKLSSSSSGEVFVVFCTVDSDGRRRREGEEWSDHCRRCVCRNGKEMCTLITCQAPKCEHPIFYPGDCCPRCPVEETSVSFSQVNGTVCLSSDGTERIEGEIWTLSSCLTCTCHTGQVLCASADCPPTPCANPKLVDCCLQCPTRSLKQNGNEVGNEGDDATKDGQHSDMNSQLNGLDSPSNKNCLSDDSIKTYLDGETWKVGACQSCRCEDGQIQCFSAGKCPPLECSRPVLAKNQCCPICLGNLAQKNIMEQQHHHHGGEGFEIHHIHGVHDATQLNHGISSTTTTTSRGPGGGLEPHCAVLIACLLVVTILLSLYTVRQVCFHRRVSRRLIKKVPVGFHSSSSSSHSPSVTPDCCYKCDYSKYCDTGGCVIVGGGSSCVGTSRSASSNSSRAQGECISSRTSSTNGSNGHLSSEQKPLFQNSEHLENGSVSSSLVMGGSTASPTPPTPGLTQNLLRDSDKV